MNGNPIQWHPGFQSALQVELQDDSSYLTFEKERNLTQKPLQIDTVIIKKEGHQVSKSIGRFFRKYNIVEYKSPDDYVSINVFYKVLAYACLYQSETEHVNEIDPRELTITLVCSHFPRELMKHLYEMFGTEAEEVDAGIYHLTKVPFPVQLIIIPKLSREEYVWMSRLRYDLTVKEDIEPLLKAYRSHDHSPLYQSVMNLIVRANKDEYEEAKGMCDALMELFADELREKGQSAWLEGQMDTLITMVRRKYEKGLSTAETADCLEVAVSVIEDVYEQLRRNPDADNAEICKQLKAVNI
ncbi:MAG: 3-isopropylmalate dehydrogenase [Eubacteriales bacterium]|nr:3-isopropylmalate dehydrogenase [Eubacteriales bacterium]